MKVELTTEEHSEKSNRAPGCENIQALFIYIIFIEVNKSVYSNSGIQIITQEGKC